jgi:hypothetical protein
MKKRKVVKSTKRSYKRKSLKITEKFMTFIRSSMMVENVNHDEVLKTIQLTNPSLDDVQAVLLETTNLIKDYKENYGNKQMVVTTELSKIYNKPDSVEKAELVTLVDFLAHPTTNQSGIFTTQERIEATIKDLETKIESQKYALKLCEMFMDIKCSDKLVAENTRAVFLQIHSKLMGI